MKYSLVVILVHGLAGSLALEPLHSGSQEAICQKNVSIDRSRFVTYWETYREERWGYYETKYRRNYRLEYHTEYEMIEVCCEGYTQDGDYCAPLCDPPCENAICSDRNFCTCRWGYDKIQPDTPNVCDPVCYQCPKGSKCTAPFVCTCDEGYERTSFSYGDSDCTPICSQNCTDVNAYCESPDVCKCSHDYEAVYSEDNRLERCAPICYKRCVNADCVAPGHCECHAGYELMPKYSDYGYVIENECEPTCDEVCRFGKCTAPNECTCDEGYSRKNATFCEPICTKTCENGYCLLPDVCSCHEGYGFASNSITHCEPMCQKACVNGACTSPDTCTCHAGYKPSEDPTMSHICEPHCEPPCGPFGFCTAPDTCACIDGYRLRREDDYSNRSLFQEAQTSFGDAVCEPICNGCTNGDCIAPHVCDCRPGYEKKRIGTNILCRPVCKPACINGYCSQPNTCECKPGYRPIKKNLCTPFCKEPCVNGFCNAPNTCRCITGYALLNSSNVCTSICKKPCDPHASCIAPEICVCNEGYKDDGKGGCVASCKSCVNGTCVAPEICDCNEGFSFVEVEKDGVCQPFCKGCKNGDCIAPDECRCHKGFMKNEDTDDDDCVSVCEKNCNDRGECIVSNKTCECHYGWKGLLCDESKFCRIEVADNETLTTLVNNTDGDGLSKNSPLCPDDCINDINKTCVQTFRWDSENRSGIVCLIDKESECYIASTRHANGPDVTRIAGSVGGSILIIIILIATVMCLVSYKQRQRRLTLGSRSDSLYDQRRTSLLAEEL